MFQLCNQKPDSFDIEYSISSGKTEKQIMEINFSLLNPGDFFLVKMLIDGEILADKLYYKLQGDNLPDRLFFEIPPYGSTRSKRWYISFEDTASNILTLFLGIGPACIFDFALSISNRPFSNSMGKHLNLLFYQLLY